MNNYENLDCLIVERIRNGSNTLLSINSQEVNKEANKFAESTKKDAFRFVDRRLQALRKKGVISFNSKTGWVAA